MKDCGDYSGEIRLYLDHELGESGIIELCAHLKQCPACRQALAAEEELSRLLKRAQPLYSAPDLLRERIRQIAADTDPDPSPQLPPKQS